jgi:hypothetical protein
MNPFTQEKRRSPRIPGRKVGHPPGEKNVGFRAPHIGAAPGMSGPQPSPMAGSDLGNLSPVGTSPAPVMRRGGSMKRKKHADGGEPHPVFAPSFDPDDEAPKRKKRAHGGSVRGVGIAKRGFGAGKVC